MVEVALAGKTGKPLPNWMQDQARVRAR